MCGKYDFLNNGARQRAEKIVREAEKSLSVLVNVSSASNASKIAEKCTAEVLKAFTAVRNPKLKPAMFVMEITVLNGDPVEDMGKFSTKAHEIVAKFTTGWRKPRNRAKTESVLLFFVEQTTRSG